MQGPQHWQSVICKPLSDARQELCIVAMDSALTGGLEKIRFDIGAKCEVIAPYRAIFERALRYSATELVIAHNHPSGIATPSEADLVYTKKLATLARHLDICLIDHWIIAGPERFSFREAGLL